MNEPILNWSWRLRVAKPLRSNCEAVPIDFTGNLVHEGNPAAIALGTNLTRSSGVVANCFRLTQVANRHKTLPNLIRPEAHPQ